MSRRWDGEAETEADMRCWALRDSGYYGPIDRDGYAVTSGDDARILRDMADRGGEDTSWYTGADLPRRSARPAMFLASLFILAVVAAVLISQH